MAVPSHNQRSSMPLVGAIRDVLGIVKSKKELKKLLNEKKITVNGKIVRETNYPVSFADILGFPSIKKHYTVTLKNKRYEFVEIPESHAGSRIYKVIGKKLLGVKKIQLNLSSGRNILTSDKIKIGNFVLVDNAKNKIMKVIEMKKDTEVIVIAGKHTGKTGKVKDVLKEGENLVAVIKTKEGEIKANVKNIFATA